MPKYHVKMQTIETCVGGKLQIWIFPNWNPKTIHTPRLPYYFCMILLLSLLKEWALETLALEPILIYHIQELHKRPQFDKVYVCSITWKFCGIRESSRTPCIIDRGGWDKTNKFFTAHFKATFVSLLLLH